MLAPVGCSGLAKRAGDCESSPTTGAMRCFEDTVTNRLFPSLRIDLNGFEALGPFAEAQARFLQPDTAVVAELDAMLRRESVGVVAHFYMDVELQGVLSACTWPQIHVSDSLAMADAAVQMARDGVRNIVVLGVDFMSENVRAMLDAAGFVDLPVYRLSAEPIGCSLAEAAEARAYDAYLRRAFGSPRSLHVIYINTSLRTKARSHAILPTITCTSSNVVQTVLQAFAQVPDLTLWFGPDTYMGENLSTLFGEFAQRSDAQIADVHPDHDRASISALLPRLHCFEQGTCIVHHMFGEAVVKRVRDSYPDAYYTAHLEVPGEMFALAANAQRQGRGVVGSTSAILAFINERLAAATTSAQPASLPFVLGTEAGMVTPVARHVRKTLAACGRDDITVEIIFPVAQEAVAQSPDRSLGIVPGVAGGEGCSTAGGCATCPYMKMNSLAALLDVLGGIESGGVGLQSLWPRTYTEEVAGLSVAELGSQPILHMRSFQQTGRLSDALVDDIMARSGAAMA